MNKSRRREVAEFRFHRIGRRIDGDNDVNEMNNSAQVVKHDNLQSNRNSSDGTLSGRYQLREVWSDATEEIFEGQSGRRTYRNGDEDNTLINGGI